MFLRDFLYVDLDKVSGLASQLYDGVADRATKVSTRQKSLVTNLNVIRGGSESVSEESTERNLRDSLFRVLENDLESLGALKDVSELLADEVAWESIEDIAAPGTVLRITAPGTLFHPEQMSDSIVGIATAAHGISELADTPQGIMQTPPTPPRAKSDAQKKRERAARLDPHEPRFPEDFIPAGDLVPIMNVPRELFTGMIKATRGIFGAGLHLHLRPAGIDGPVISARLEEGRRFLDSSPEVLFSRYGLATQEWTVVGIVGQLGSAKTTSAIGDPTNPDESINRAKFVDVVREFLDQAAGLVDLPKAPGFSIVPLALYRSIGGSIE